MSGREVAWAIVPTAGRGSRLAPATAVVPKALLPVGTLPMLHWSLAEVVAAGIDGIVLVVGPEQGLVRRYVEAARRAAASPSGELARLGRGLRGREIVWIEQPEPRGIGDAFLRCRRVTGEDAFAVVVPDNWFDARPPAIAQVRTTYARTGACTLGLTVVNAEEAHLFGNVGGVQVEASGGRAYRIHRLQDKLPGTFALAPLRQEGRAGGQEILRGCARYVLGPEFYRALEETGPPAEGEWDDVPAFQRLIQQGALYGHRIEGRHYDVGLPGGYLAAAAYLAARARKQGGEGPQR